MNQVFHLVRGLNGLVLYRMVFGQTWQEDLINFLQDTVEDSEMAEILNYRIDLEPKSVERI